MNNFKMKLEQLNEGVLPKLHRIKVTGPVSAIRLSQWFDEMKKTSFNNHFIKRGNEYLMTTLDARYYDDQIQEISKKYNIKVKVT